MFKSRKFNLILIGCIGLFLGAVLLSCILSLRSGLTNVSSTFGGTIVASSAVVNLSADIVSQVMEWMKRQESWIMFLIVVGVSFVVVAIILFFAWSIYRMFFKRSRGDHGSALAYEGEMDMGDEEFSPPPPAYASGLRSDPYGNLTDLPPRQLGQNSVSSAPQLERVHLPDMASITKIAPPNVGNDVASQSKLRNVSVAVQEKLGFDLNSPFVSQHIGPRLNEPMTEFDLVQRKIDDIRAERDTIEERLLKVSEEYNLLKVHYENSVSQAENDIIEMQTEIADLQGWLHQAPKKEKERILDEIEAREMAIGEAYAHISSLSDPNSGALADLNVLKNAQTALYNSKIENEEELVKAKSELQLLNMREELEAPEREKIRKEKVVRLRQIMQEANRLQSEDDIFEEQLNKRNKEKELLKTENITLQHAIMSMADLEEVVNISQKIQSNNQAIMALDKKNSDELRNRTVRPASLSKLKRDADDLIIELNLSYAEVAKEEDDVLIEETRQRLIDDINESKRVAQDMIIRSQHKHDALTQDYHRNLTDAAFDISNAMRDAESDVVAASDKLKSIVDQLVTAKGAQANLLTIDRLAAEDAVQLAKVNLERVKAQGIKDRIVAKTKLDNDIVEAAKDVDRARRDYDALISKQRNVDSEAVYAVISGSGVISKICKEYEKLKKEKEESRLKIKLEYDRRQAELLGERERLGEEADLEARLQMALQQDVIKAQKGDKEARARLESHLIAKMSDDEKELFSVMRPDEKWRYMVMEVEEIIRRAQHSSKEKLAALVAEEEALLIKLEADERVRKAEDAAEEAMRKMESQIAQSQIDADYARLQSVDTLVAAKELAEKQAEEIMRVAYEERRKAADLIDSVKQRSLEAKRQAEEIVANIKMGNLGDIPNEVSAQNIADSNVQFNSILEQIINDSNTTSASAAQSVENLEPQVQGDQVLQSNDAVDPMADFQNQILSKANLSSASFEQPAYEPFEQPVATSYIEMPVSSFEMPTSNFNENVDSIVNQSNLKYTGPIHSKSDFSANNLQNTFESINSEIEFAARDLEYAKTDLERAKQVAQNSRFDESSKYVVNAGVGNEGFLVEKSTRVEDIEQLINAKVEQRLKEEDQKREELDKLKKLEEEQKKQEELRQKQLDDELEKIRQVRQKIEQEQAQQKLLLEEKFRAESQRAKSNSAEEIGRLESIQQQALLFEKQTIEAQKKALEEEKKVLENEKLIKQQIEDAKTQLKEEQERIEQERQKQIEDANREVEKLKQELQAEKQKEELRKLEEEKQLQISFIAQQLDELRQQVQNEKQNVEHIKSLHEQELKHQQEQYQQELKEIEQQQVALAQDTEAQLLKCLDLTDVEVEEEMKNAPYFSDEQSGNVDGNQRGAHPYLKVRDNVNIVASDIRRMAKDAAAQAVKQAQEAKEEAERVRQAMELEILRVRQEMESSLKQKELDAQFAAYELKAQEEIKQAVLRAEKAEALAKQAEQTEIVTRQKVEEAIQSARKAAEEAIADAVKQSKDANEMVNTIRSQADLEVNELRKELQRELQEMRLERDKEIGQRASEYEKALMSAETAAAARAEKAEKAFVELEQATQRAIADSERRAEQLAKDSEERANLLAQQAQFEADRKAKEAEEKAKFEAKLAQEQAEQKAKEAEERVRQLAREAEDKVKEAEERARQIAREAEEKARLEARLAQEQAEQKAKEAEERARLEAKLAQEQAEQRMREAEERVRQLAREAEDKVKEAEERARQIARESEEKARQEARIAQELAEQRAKEVEERVRQEARLVKEQVEQKARETEEKARLEARLAQEQAEQRAKEVEERVRQEVKIAQELAEQKAKDAEERARILAREAEDKAREIEERAKLEARQVQLDAQQQAREALEKASQQTKEAQEKESRISSKVAIKKSEIALLRERIAYIKSDSDLNVLLEKLNNISRFLDEDERSSTELNDLISRTISDARHASEVAALKAKLDETIATSPVAKPSFENLLPPPLRRPRPPVRRRVMRARPPMRPRRPLSSMPRPSYREGSRAARPGQRPPRPRAPRDY